MGGSAERLQACSGDAKTSREEPRGALLVVSAVRAMLTRMKSVWKPSIRTVADLHSWLAVTWHTSSSTVTPNTDRFSTFIPAGERVHVSGSRESKYT